MYHIPTLGGISFMLKLYYKIEYFPSVGSAKPPSILKSFLRNFVFIVFFVIYVVLLMANAFIKKNLTDSVFLLASATEIAVLSVRLIVFARNKDDIMFLINEMTIHSVELEESYRKVSKKMNKFRKFLCCVAMMNLFGTISIIALPLMSADKKLVFEIWLPIEYGNGDYVFWMAYGYTTTCFCVAVLSVSAVAIVWYLFFHGVLMYEILGDNLKLIGYTGKYSLRKYRTEQQCVDELKSHIIRHQTINRHIDRLRNCFSEIILFQIITSGVLNCGLAFTLTSGALNSPFEYALLVNILVYILADIFLILFFCNDITLKSDHLSQCLFESNWMNQSLEFRRLMIMWMGMLKKPKRLYVGGKNFPLNLETFSAIVNFTYRLLNILREME